MNLAAWSTRARVAHLPEIVFMTEAQDPLGGCPHLLPETFSVFIRRHFRVALVNREPQSLWIEFQNINQQLPGKLDRVFLEIVAKRKITQHLEKRVMPRGLSYLVKIVVLAACTHTLLR